MRQVLLVLTLLAFGLLATAAPGPAIAGGSPALLNCADVNGDGAVIAADIAVEVQQFGFTAQDHPDDYLALYDLDGPAGRGAIGAADIASVVLDFGRFTGGIGPQNCPLHDSQVAQATLAMIGTYGGPDVRDPAQALAAGYIKSSQNVPAMGIHMFNTGYMQAWPNCCELYDPDDPSTESQLIHPVGLVYTQGPGGALGTLIGAWYIQPNDVVCDFYGVAGPCQSLTDQPVGFGDTNTDEDNQELSSVQQGWHDHTGLCIWNWGEPNANVTEGASFSQCDGTGGIWFSTYGWMMHLYNFILNPDGRFMKWNFDL